MTIIEWMTSVKEDLKAWRRGEKRVAPRGTRGRVYVPRNPDVAPVGAGDVKEMKSKATATLHMKIVRKDGTVEERVVPAQVVKR